jgi:hypothetical protein
MASIKLKGDTSGEITISSPAVAGTTTLTLPKTTSTLATENALGVRNLIINGDMRIDQRNSGSSVTLPSNSNYYTIDRFAFTINQASKMSAQQVTDAPTGFVNSLKVTTTSAYTVTASDYFVVRQDIEGQNISHLDWGSSNAKTITLSFYVKSSLTGTFGGSLKNSSANKSYPYTYTIDSANTWERKTITIEGETAGTWLTTNGRGIMVNFGLGVGSTFSGTSGAWASSNYLSATGATSVVGTASATWQVTGIQLEVGDTATEFEHRPYDMELARCQRYYEKSYQEGVTVPTNTYDGSYVFAPSTTTNNQHQYVTYTVRKRANGTVTGYNPADSNTSNPIRYSTSNKPWNQFRKSQNGFAFHVNNSSIVTNGTSYVQWVCDAEL